MTLCLSLIHILFHASSYISHLSEGKVKITPTFVDELNAVLTKYQQDTVTSDYDDHFKVGKVIEMKEHPDSDHMHICQVDTGDEILQIVCGCLLYTSMLWQLVFQLLLQ